MRQYLEIFRNWYSIWTPDNHFLIYMVNLSFNHQKEFFTESECSPSSIICFVDGVSKCCQGHCNVRRLRFCTHKGTTGLGFLLVTKE